MTGNFSGKTYRVIGRVVMGVVDLGTTSYWNEFNLQGDGGEFVTLVYEQTERGGEWRWFTMFEPECPMSAQEAATKRMGDRLDFGDGPVSVTLLNLSQVYFVEGQAPEGEFVGAHANYFNAESGSEMIVVSWTREEVEFYRGWTLPRGTVETAFNIRQPILSNFALSGSGSDSSRSNLIQLIGLLLVIGFVVFTAWPALNLRGRANPVKIFAASPSPLHEGFSGSLEGKDYRISWHDLVEIAEVGLRFQRHEFQLTNHDGSQALLVCGLEPNAKEWCLFTPLEPLQTFTPQQAGHVHFGETVNVDGLVAPVRELFRSTAFPGTGPISPAITYGFIARTNSTILLVRWSENGIAFHSGKLMPAKTLTAAFGLKNQLEKP
jgi:hypothetical protein